MAELNGGQLVVLLENWKHPVIKPFLATTAAGLAAITVYEKGLSSGINIKRLNHFIAYLAAPELRRDRYTPEKQLSPNHPVSEIFGLLEPELFSAINTTARTSTPDLKLLPSHASGAPQTTTSPPFGTQAQDINAGTNASILGLAAVVIAIATVAIFFAPKICSKYRTAKAQKLIEAQLNNEMKQLSKKLAVTMTLNDGLFGKLEKVKQENERLKRQLEEKEKTTNAFSKLSIIEISGEDYNDDELGHNTTGSNDCSQQDSPQQQDCRPGMSESLSNITTTEEVMGEHASMPMTRSIPAFGEVNISNRKKREAWHSHWRSRAMMRVYSDDVVYKMELPCFDAWFAGIGIATPAARHEDRRLENGKLLEHTKCVHCLQWYTKKDMYDHLKTCKAFWELAIRCGHCKETFKYNTAFFDQHVPDCKAQSTEEDRLGEHYTLAILEAGTSTTQTFQQVGLSSSVFSSPKEQINRNASPFAPSGLPPWLRLPSSVGPHYASRDFQYARGTPFNSPQALSALPTESNTTSTSD
jgi:hypothetical protein